MYHYDALGNLYRKNCSDGSDYQYLVDPYGTYGADIVAEVHPCFFSPRYCAMIHSIFFMSIKISDEGVTYFVHSLEYGLIAAVNLTDGSVYYHIYDGDG